MPPSPAQPCAAPLFAPGPRCRPLFPLLPKSSARFGRSCASAWRPPARARIYGFSSALVVLVAAEGELVQTKSRLLARGGPRSLAGFDPNCREHLAVVHTGMF